MINHIFNQKENIREAQIEIKEIADDLEEYLREEFDIESAVYTDRERFEIQLFSYEDVESVTEKEPKIIYRHDTDYPYEAFGIIDDIVFFTILTEEEYKKATAPTAADES